MIVCSYLLPQTAAQLRVLVSDLQDHDPGVDVVALDLTDGSLAIDGVRLVAPSDLVSAATARDIAVIGRTAQERVAALLPHLIAGELDRGADAVAWIVPSTCIRGSLADVVGGHANADLVLARRLDVGVEDDGMRPAPIDIIRRGIVSDEFFVARGGSARFVSWWRARTDVAEAVRRTKDLLDHPSLFFDQSTRYTRWLDAAPSFDGLDVAFTDTWGRSPWNVGVDDLRGDASLGFVVEDVDLGAPWRGIPRFDEASRFRFSQHPELWSDVRAWIGRVDAARTDADTAAREWGAERADGAELQPRMRRVHERARYLGDDIDGSPLEADSLAAYDSWLRAPEPGTRIGRYLHDIWRARADLWAAFPDAPNGDADAFEAWIRGSGGVESGVPEQLMPRTDTPSAELIRTSAGSLEHGVIVSGYLNSVMGLGEAARLVADAVSASDLPVGTISYSRTVAEQDEAYSEVTSGRLDLDTHVACVNIDTFTSFARDLGSGAFEGRHTVGLWFWETSVIPDALLGAFEFVDEIWVACEFVRDVLARYTDKPISIYPQPVPVPERGDVPRAELGLPEGFTFLFAFDFNSVIERKNPLGIVDAFRKAFSPGEGPQLVLKTINGARRSVDYERLVLATLDRPDIHVVDEFFPTWKRDAWTAECDCYISLHRSEGFGLTMAEAMACGKPVIASRYSGNLAFMNDQNSLLVDCGEATVPPGCDPYPAGALWAEPDVGQAARHMRAVFEDSDLRARLGAQARADIVQHHDRAAMARWIRENLESRWAREAQPAGNRMLRRLVRR